MGKTTVLNPLNLTKASNGYLNETPVDVLNKTLESSIDPSADLGITDEEQDFTSYATEKYKVEERNDQLQSQQKANHLGIVAQAAREMGYSLEELNSNPKVYESVKAYVNEKMGTTGQMLNIAKKDSYPGQGAQFSEDVELDETQEAALMERRRATEDLGSISNQDWTDEHSAELNEDQANAMHSSIDSFLEIGDRTERTVKALGARIKGKTAKRFVHSIAYDLELEPATVGEYLNGFVQSYASIEEQGMGRTYTDIVLAAELKEAMRNEWINVKNRENPSDEFIGAEETEDLGFSSGKDAIVGRRIHEAMGIKHTPQTNAIAGAIARKVVVDANSNLFESKQVSIDDNKTVTLSTLKWNTVGQIEGMTDLLDIMMPDTIKQVRHNPKVDKSNYTSPKKNDKSRYYGDFRFVNDTIDVLDNTGHSLAFSNTTFLATGNILEMIDAAQPEALNGKNWIKVRYDPATGQELVVQLDKNGKERSYVGNNVKRKQFSTEIAFAKSQTGNRLYWDHNLGSNNRFYTSSFAFDGSSAGNFHGSKTARAMLQAMKPETYNIKKGSPELNQLKAGIMLKFGSKHVDKVKGVHKTVKDLVEEFDTIAAKWQSMMGTQELVAQNINEITEAAGEHEGPISISAMVEGVKLMQAVKSGQGEYRSKFYTEIDGIANGVAHNILQSGANGPKGGRILSAVGLFTEGALKEMKDGTFTAEDVYEITVNAALSSLYNSSSNPQEKAKIDAILSAFTDPNGNTMINRNFGKKPMMIFGYGAGNATIRREVNAWIADMLSDPTNGNILASLESAGYSVADAEKVLGDGVTGGVKVDFDVVKKLNDAMQGIAKATIDAGVDPTYVTREGHIINFGQWFNEVDTDVPSVPVRYSTAALKAKDLKTWGIDAKAYARKKGVNPKSVTEYTDKDGKVIIKTGVKAIKQSGVLTTQAQDGINIGMTMMALAKKYGNGSSKAAQIFDAVMVTPKEAANASRQLNQDFYELNKEFSMVKEFMEQMQDKGVTILPKLANAVAAIIANRARLFEQLKASGVNQFPWPK